MNPSPRVKTFAELLFAGAVCLAVCLGGCRVKPQEEVVGGFEAHKGSFVTAAAYIEDFAWGDEWCCSVDTYLGFINVSYRADIPDKMVPKRDRDVSAALRVLFGRLGYVEVERNKWYRNTISFELRPASLRPEYYNQGICYSIDGTEPVPELDLDYHTEYLEPLGDGWYYWNGHCYFG